MTLRRQYLITGIAWALLLGPLTAYWVFGFAAGVSWLWLFGDDPLPAATQWALPLIGFTGGILAAIACVISALLYRRRRAAPASDLRRERQWVLLFIIALIVLIALLGAELWREGEQYSRAKALASKREAAFAALVGARHEIRGLTVDRRSSGSFHVTVQLAGQREGDYRLSWKVAGTSFGTVLASGEQRLGLEPGTQHVQIGFTLDELAHRYKTRVLSGSGGVLVEEPFRLAISLLPVLSPSQRQALLPGERYRHDAGDTPLRNRQSVEFPVRFIIRGDGSIEQ